MPSDVIIDGESYKLAPGPGSVTRTLDPGFPPVLVSDAEAQVSSFLPHQTIRVPASAGLGRYRPRGDEPVSPNLVWDMENLNNLHGFFALGPLKQEITNKPANVTARYSHIQRIGNTLWSMERHDDRAIAAVTRTSLAGIHFGAIAQHGS